MQSIKAIHFPLPKPSPHVDSHKWYENVDNVGKNLGLGEFR